MVLPKGGSHYEQFSCGTKERRQNLKEKEEGEKGRSCLPLNTPTFTETGLFCQQTG
jgi:hypothetical protein